MEPVRRLNWDSAHFGINIGRVFPDGAQSLEKALLDAERLSLDCLYLLVESDNPASVRLASEFGWRMVDMRVTLNTGLPERPAQPAECSVRRATAADLPYLKQLAANSHRDSRFYADGNFQPEACDQLFSLWIERSVQDRDFAGAVFVPEIAGEPVGYITCTIKQGIGDIGLIAVDPQAQRRGIGTLLLAEGARWFREQGASLVSVVTQGRNIPALRMYERSGFTVESIQLWFHWWRAGYRMAH